MKETQYIRFSAKTHTKNWQMRCPSVCEFELTFKCGLHCRHCYTDCYNKPGLIKDELDTKKIKSILDKVHAAGVIWLCFTGGDPLTRKDFPEIYAYAKNKGFIVTLFTNACSMTEEIADALKKSPPFVIEITLNAVTRDRYELISRVKGSFERAMDGIRMITERGLPLKIKTLVTRDNLEDVPRIKKYVESLGLDFKPSSLLQSRLDGDASPCALRISPNEVVALGKWLQGKGDTLLDGDDCRPKPEAGDRERKTDKKTDTRLFSCAISGGDGLRIDPNGYLVPCNCIREPKINVTRQSVKKAQEDTLAWVRSRVFTADSKCKTCREREACFRCPGKALIEKGSLEAEIEWFCELARLS